jgi:hypothetical protein
MGKFERNRFFAMMGAGEPDLIQSIIQISGFDTVSYTDASWPACRTASTGNGSGTGSINARSLFLSSTNKYSISRGYFKIFNPSQNVDRAVVRLKASIPFTNQDYYLYLFSGGEPVVSGDYNSWASLVSDTKRPVINDLLEFELNTIGLDRFKLSGDLKVVLISAPDVEGTPIPTDDSGAGAFSIANSEVWYYFS